MRSRAFATVMAVLCAATAVGCVALGLRFWRIWQLRRAFPRAVALFNAGQLEDALAPLDKAIANAPTKTDPYRLGALIGSRLKRPELMERYYAGLLEHAGGAQAAEAHLHLAFLAFQPPGKERQPDLAAAVERLEAARKGYEEAKDPTRLATILALLATLHARTGKPADATACRDRLAELPKSALTGRVALVVARWQLADKVRSGKAKDLVDAWNTYLRLVQRHAVEADFGLRGTLGLALAFRVNDPELSASERRMALRLLEGLPLGVRTKHELRLRLLAAAGWERLGNVDQAFQQYRKALKAGPDDPRVQRAFARALMSRAAKAIDPQSIKRYTAEAIGLYRTLFDSGKLPAADRGRLAVALATRAWNAGQRDEAAKLLEAAGDVDSPHVERMKATAALAKGDYDALIAHLRRARDHGGHQPGVTALLRHLDTPPDISDFRVNGLSAYDPQPILSAAFAPRSVPKPIAAKDVGVTLDGAAVQAIITAGECFYRPPAPLKAGDHRFEVSVVDSRGLKATQAFPFTIRLDQDPPAIVGIAPPPDGNSSGDAGGLMPLVTFRCADPSGIDPRSLTVTFSGLAGQPPRRRQFTIVRNGAYAVSVNGPKVKIEKGTRVQNGFVRFQPSKPLAPGECRVSVGVSDRHGNRCSKNWAFQCTD